jgi:hypothetical protein
VPLKRFNATAVSVILAKKAVVGQVHSDVAAEGLCGNASVW